MIGLIDTHCHLNDASFANDLKRVLQSAESAGIEKIIVPAVDIKTSYEVVELAHKYPELYAAVGVHPEEVDSFSDLDMRELEKLAIIDKVVAIGEIGLDFHYPPFDEKLQRDVFHRMLDLATKVKKPVLIHSRDAIVAVLQILRSWRSHLETNGIIRLIQNPGILHAFEGNLEQANQALEMNFVIGLGGPITYKNSKDKVSIASLIDLQHLVLETDSPYLPPHPYRGQRNEPAYLLEVAKKLSEIKKQPIELIVTETGLTGKRILNLDD